MRFLISALPPFPFLWRISEFRLPSSVSLLCRSVELAVLSVAPTVLFLDCESHTAIVPTPSLISCPNNSTIVVAPPPSLLTRPAPSLFLHARRCRVVPPPSRLPPPRRARHPVPATAHPLSTNAARDHYHPASSTMPLPIPRPTFSSLHRRLRPPFPAPPLLCSRALILPQEAPRPSQFLADSIQSTLPFQFRHFPKCPPSFLAFPPPLVLWRLFFSRFHSLPPLPLPTLHAPVASPRTSAPLSPHAPWPSFTRRLPANAALVTHHTLLQTAHSPPRATRRPAKAFGHVSLLSPSPVAPPSPVIPCSRCAHVTHDLPISPTNPTTPRPSRPHLFLCSTAARNRHSPRPPLLCSRALLLFRAAPQHLQLQS